MLSYRVRTNLKNVKAALTVYLKWALSPNQKMTFFNTKFNQNCQISSLFPKMPRPYPVRYAKTLVIGCIRICGL